MIYSWYSQVQETWTFFLVGLIKDPKLISSIESSIPTKTLTRQIQTGPAKLKIILVDNQPRIDSKKSSTFLGLSYTQLMMCWFLFG
jgi:hypothetical protein